MAQKICGTCNHYQPSSDIEGCGVCSQEDLWSARPQEVMADMYACAEHNSRSLWTPLNVSSAPSPQVGRPAWAKWTQWIGIVGLLLTPPIFIIDLFVGVPGLPEFSILWGLFFLALAAVGFLWGKI
jgi:hypothetical protein